MDYFFFLYEKTTEFSEDTENHHYSVFSASWYEKKDQLQPVNTIKHIHNFKIDYRLYKFYNLYYKKYLL